MRRNSWLSAGAFLVTGLRRISEQGGFCGSPKWIAGSK
jgi:hypothetical protein